MIAQLRHGLAVAYTGFASSRNTMIAQLLIVTLSGALTIMSMNNVANRDNEKAIAVRTR